MNGKFAVTSSRAVRGVRRTAVVLALAVAAMLMAGSVPMAHANARPTAPLSPATGALFGAHVGPLNGDWSQSNVQATIQAREEALGVKLGIDSHKYGWRQAFPSWAEPWDIANGRLPMISWTGMDSASVNAGLEDATITARADAVKGLSGTVFLNLAPQMDGQGASGTAEEFIAAWKRVRSLFAGRGTTNVAWVWCPTAAAFQSGKATWYYPGDASVDWICAEGYNWSPGVKTAKWRSFFGIFHPFYQWASARPKPLIVVGTGAQERWGDEKATWIANMHSVIKQWPRIQGLVYTDARTSYDWRADTSASSFTSYKALANDTHFNPTPATSTTSPTSTTSGAMLGAYVQPSDGWTKGEVQRDIVDLETRTGAKLDIDHHFWAWKKAFPAWQIPWDLEQGRIPMVSWGAPPVVTEITDGTHDAWIRQQADAIKSVNKPVFIRFFWEMDIKNAQAVGPSEFIASWRRLHTMFQNRGATNARFVWCPTAWNFTKGKSQTFYPGDAYVDWICADGYNWGTSTDGKWRSFEQIFADFYAWAAPRGKPIMIGETGTREGDLGWKAKWITEMATSMKLTYPKMKAVVLFDSYTTNYGGDWFDWRLDTSWSSFDAWKNVNADPYFLTPLIS